MALYYVGTRIEVPASFTHLGQPADPSTVGFDVTRPDGSTQTYTVGTDNEAVRDALGSYHLDLTLDAPGTFSIRGWGAGAVVAAARSYFTVLP